MLVMGTWEDFESPGWAVWCDKTAVLGALMALRGELLTGPALVDAVGLVDGLSGSTTWSSMRRWMPNGLSRWLMRLHWDRFSPPSARNSARRSCVPGTMAAWVRTASSSGAGTSTNRASASRSPTPIAWSAPLEEFTRSLDRADTDDMVGPGSAMLSMRQQPAYSTARALSGGMIVAQLGMFHMPTAIRCGLLAWFDAPCQVTSLIAIEPVADARLPSAFGRVTDVQIERQCDVWDAVATVRHDSSRSARRCAAPSPTHPGSARPSSGGGRTARCSARPTPSASPGSCSRIAVLPVISKPSSSTAAGSPTTGPNTTASRGPWPRALGTTAASWRATWPPAGPGSSSQSSAAPAFPRTAPASSTTCARRPTGSCTTTGSTRPAGAP